MNIPITAASGRAVNMPAEWRMRRVWQLWSSPSRSLALTVLGCHRCSARLHSFSIITARDGCASCPSVSPRTARRRHLVLHASRRAPGDEGPPQPLQRAGLLERSIRYSIKISSRSPQDAQRTANTHFLPDTNPYDMSTFPGLNAYPQNPELFVCDARVRGRGCPQVMTGDQAQAHVYQAHGIAIPTATCTFCGWVFRSLSRFARHQYMHIAITQCTPCNRIFRTPQERFTHYVERHGLTADSEQP